LLSDSLDDYVSSDNPVRLVDVLVGRGRPQRRARVMFKFKSLLEEHMRELAHLMSCEHGK
jgi:hypothetical protein